MRKISIAVAGAGLIGRRHIELLQANPACELAAIIDPLLVPADYLAGLGVTQYPDLQRYFAEHRPDGIILATPNALHVEQTLQCIEAGVAALIEKPVAHSVEAGKRLLAIAEAANAKLLVGHHRAHSPILAKARELVSEGVLGDLVAVQGSALFYKPDDYFDGALWRRQAGGGPILINMIHEIGNLRALCGEIVAVQAMQSNAARGFAVEDTVCIGLRFANGALGSFLLSDTAGCARSWEQTSQENADYPWYDDEDCYVISGKNGTLSVPTLRLKSYPDASQRSWWKPFRTATAEVVRQDPLALQLVHFCNLIQGKEAPRVTVRDGLLNLIITEAIAEAARTGRIVEIDPL
ncbi:1,5-anhydro-D-fructose reductase [Pseudomonas reidholzensis]|uniref:1,5-anhydro-D-fructose reductase n=1 Tax=Pseudomonas reidholzensis TaxID=1785162 RepID=A0A383RQS6_9PSED|nr:Gfo/Idh/MocA family oxidoreductase [Pseudomonas reidholzensis]SYX89004.1 1,5-anhydro-D-fructose reductase [Pseudomonas reidholzensis]